MTHRRLTLLLLLLLALPASAEETPRSTATTGGKVVAVVGSTTIIERQLAGRVMGLMRQMTFHRNINDKLLRKLRKMALDQLIEDELLLAEAARRKLLPKDADVTRTRDLIVARAGGKKAYDARLKAQHVSWNDNWQILRREMAIGNLLALEVVGPSRLTDAQLKAHYDANRRRFRRPPEARLRYLLAEVRASASPAEWEAARKKAEASHARLKAGADFAKLATGNKLPAGLYGAGGMGWVHQGRLTPEVDEVAFKLKVGEYSPPIKTLFGYVIVRCEGTREGRQMEYAEIAKGLRTELTEKAEGQRRTALLARLRAGTKLQRFE